MNIEVNTVYPITITTYPDGSKSMPYITDFNLKHYTDPSKFEELGDYLAGQTRYVEGVYAHDVETWLNNNRRRT